ncbi:MAG TPA: substrate-binding domain-containing protein [Solirubrobacterales bacterium]
MAAIGFGATGSASASLGCNGEDIAGKGSSLQKIAQENVWDPAFNTEVCAFGEEPKVSYVSAGSGAGMEEWNHNNVKKSINTAFSFIGTDDAPTAAQIANMTSVSSGAGVLTIPVAQTAIAIMADPPAGCSVESITNKDLENVFNGSIIKWSQLEQFLTAKGGAPDPACNFRIKRVVRAEGSGTTYQIKNYFNLIRGKTKGVPCTEGATEGLATWGELETNGAGGHPNIDWPKDEGCAIPLTEIVTAAGGGALAKFVAENSGTIGYASLPDVKSKIAECEEKGTCKNPEVLKVQYNAKKKLSEALYASPQSGETANCSTASYTVPALARRAVSHNAANVDWSQVFGAKTNTEKSGAGYGICTLTYALAWNKYSGPGFTAGQEETAKDFLAEYVTATAGQEDIESRYYQALPVGTSSATNVLDAAQFTAGKIGF